MGKLTALEVGREMMPGKYPDGDGLYLVVSGHNAKSWFYRYWLNGKERWHGLGSFKDVSLKQAREKRDAARQQVRDKRDIVQERRDARVQDAEVAAQVRVPTFKEAAESYIRKSESSWKNTKHREQWSSSLKRFAYPIIGDLPVNTIQPSHIYDLLVQVVPDGIFWLVRRETSNRVRGRIETILAKEADPNDKDFRNPAELTKVLREKLPTRPKRQRKSHAALPYDQAAEFMQKLHGAQGVAARALEFTILTAARTNETLLAQRSEIDRSERKWVVPAERMKMSRDHVVPLSDAAIAVLDKLPADGEILFPGEANPQLSDAAMTAVLKRLGYGHVTVHGMRATFGTWAEECTNYPDGVREAALAQQYKNETTAAYQRGNLLEKRRALMNDWQNFLQKSSARVIPIRVTADA